MIRGGLFLDRDGTIIEDLGYLRMPREVVFFPDTFEALRRAGEDYELFIVTNQSGIAKGVIGEEEAAAVNQFVVDELAKHGITIRAVYTCPHDREDQCRCRKPNPYFLQQAAREFGVDLSRSYVIGDHPHDVETGIRAGGRGIFVLTGHGRRHRSELGPDCPIAGSLSEAVRMIIS